MPASEIRPDSFFLPEDAPLVPLAVLANDGFDDISILRFTSPANGSMSLRDGVLYYEPDPNFTGTDRFFYWVEDEAGDQARTTVEITVRPSAEQPQSELNPRIAPELTPSGVTMELRKVAQLPAGLGGAPAKVVDIFTFGDRIYVLDQGDAINGAKVHALRPDGAGAYETALFLDVEAVDDSAGHAIDYSTTQAGLRGFAFHPDFENNGLVYASLMLARPADRRGLTYLSDAGTDAPADSALVELRLDPDTGAVEPGSFREVFRVGVPHYDHMIKQIAFNPHAAPGEPDYGLLYVGHGDGSDAMAREGGGLRDDALGKILRIDPIGSGGSPFRVPNDNPFVGPDGMNDAVYAYGLRNPNSFSFAVDAGGETRLIVTDIGRGNFEEINIVAPGDNHGWSDREGHFLHLYGSGAINDGIAPLPRDEALGGRSYPAAFFSQGADGIGYAIAGGHVVSNGSALDGQYVFGDFSGLGKLFHVGFEDMLRQTTSLDPTDPSRDDPEELTWATPSELTLLHDHDGDAATTPIVVSSFLDILEARRSDMRIGMGPDGSLFLTNKRDGAIYQAVSTRPDATPDQQTIVVRIGGTGGPTVAPSFGVDVDGQSIGRGTISDPATREEMRAGAMAYETFVFRYDADRPARAVDIVFDTDGAGPGEVNRNLFVDSVEFGGRAYDADESGYYRDDLARPEHEGWGRPMLWSGRMTFEADLA